MSAWSHLPNAAHIDRVLASVGGHPEAWSDAYTADWAAAYDAAQYAAYDAAQYAAQYAARDAARDANSYRAAYYAARGAVLALIAYDDCAKYLSIPSDQLRVWAVLSENPAAALFIPAVIAFEKINELEMA